MTATRILHYGLEQHRAGRLDAAERAYGAALAEDACNADALHLLGQVRLARGDLAGALDLVRRAIAEAAAVALYHNTLGEVLRRRGEAAAADAAYAAATARDPGYADAWSNRGALAKSEGRLADAARYLRHAVALDPALASAHNNLGAVLLDQGDAEGAEACFRAALAEAPELAEAHGNLGNALARQRRFEAAVEAYDRALALDPGRVEIEVGRGKALADAGDFAGAVAGYQRALARAPDTVEIEHALGVALFRAGRFAEAIERFERVLARAPDHVEALVNLGNALLRRKRPEDGIVALERALALDAACDRAYFSLVAALPGECRWRRLEELAGELESRLKAVRAERPQHGGGLLPLAFTLPYFSTDIALHRRVLETVAARVAVGLRGRAQGFRHPPREDPDRRLRIGYLSPDFGDHPIGHVTVPVYGLHDRAAFEVACYATVDRSEPANPYHDRIRAAADYFVDIAALTPEAGAARIHADRIDILVDLCGYMLGGRPQVFALRPAPVQVYWLGHGGGLGARYIDYVIGDPFVTPSGDDGCYMESIARLPDSFSSADRAPIAAAPTRRADHGLPEDGVVFCAFNNALKIDRPVFDCWMEILAGVPNSVLWLNAARAGALRARLCVAAEARGVAASRLVFADRLADKAHHLARHRLADLFLDTFTFNASTTALDALWAGLPVLCVAGPHFHSRIAAGYLSAVGMPELICADRAAYRARAIALANDPAAVSALKAKLDRNRLTGHLFDGQRFVRHLECAFRAMWRRHAAGAPPASFDVAALAREPA